MTQKYKSLLTEYRQKAKRADQRMVRLEKAADSGKISDATHYAYHRAVNDIESWGGGKSGLFRFNTKPPTTTAGLKAKIKDIDRFLQSETSTVTGIREVYDKRAETFTQKTGTAWTREDLKMFDDERLQRLMDKYGSKTVYRQLANIKRKIAKAKGSGRSINAVLLGGMHKGTVDRRVTEAILREDGFISDWMQ